MKGWWIFPVALISVTVFTNSEAKTFSINKAIEEELARQKKSKTVTTTTEATTTEKQIISRHVSSYKKTPKLKTLKEILAERSIKLEPLKFKKLFEIKLPLKPKRPYISSIKRKHQSLKRDTNKDGKTQKSTLLRRISLLLDNIIPNESIEYENDKQQSITSAERNLLCPCAKSYRKNPDPPEEAAASSTIAVTAHPLQPALEAEDPEPPANHTTTSYLRRLRQNQKLPLLLARNTPRSERNHHGISKGSSAPRYWDLKRNITWHHRSSQHNTQRETSKANAEVNDKHADIDTRDSASGYRAFRRQLRSRNPANSERAPAARLLQRLTIVDDAETTPDPIRETRGNLEQHQNETQHEVKRDEEKSSELIRRRPKPTSEYLDRGPLSSDKISNFRQPVQSNETNENGNVNVTQHLTSHQRIPDGNGTLTRENKELRKQNEAVISLNRSELVSCKNEPMNKSVVVIIDGYSVTRSKSGENKFSEKSIRLQPVRDNNIGDIVLGFNI